MIAALLAIFVAATLIGYKLINEVPSLLHTPLMSGMNALSGITLLATITETAKAQTLFGTVLGCVGIAFAMINVVAGFGLTHRMLKMFKAK
jgi:putative NADPH-NAD transhydrogenase alpha subunit